MRRTPATTEPDRGIRRLTPNIHAKKKSRAQSIDVIKTSLGSTSREILFSTINENYIDKKLEAPPSKVEDPPNPYAEPVGWGNDAHLAKTQAVDPSRTDLQKLSEDYLKMSPLQLKGMLNGGKLSQQSPQSSLPTSGWAADTTENFKLGNCEESGFVARRRSEERFAERKDQFSPPSPPKTNAVEELKRCRKLEESWLKLLQQARSLSAHIPTPSSARENKLPNAVVISDLPADCKQKSAICLTPSKQPVCPLPERVINQIVSKNETSDSKNGFNCAITTATGELSPNDSSKSVKLVSCKKSFSSAAKSETEIIELEKLQSSPKKLRESGETQSVMQKNFLSYEMIGTAPSKSRELCSQKLSSSYLNKLSSGRALEASATEKIPCSSSVKACSPQSEHISTSYEKELIEEFSSAAKTALPPLRADSTDPILSPTDGTDKSSAAKSVFSASEHSPPLRPDDNVQAQLTPDSPHSCFSSLYFLAEAVGRSDGIVVTQKPSIAREENASRHLSFTLRPGDPLFAEGRPASPVNRSRGSPTASVEKSGSPFFPQGESCVSFNEKEVHLNGLLCRPQRNCFRDEGDVRESSPQWNRGRRVKDQLRSRSPRRISALLTSHREGGAAPRVHSPLRNPEPPSSAKEQRQATLRSAAAPSLVKSRLTFSTARTRPSSPKLYSPPFDSSSPVKDDFEEYSHTKTAPRNPGATTVPDHRNRPSLVPAPRPPRVGPGGFGRTASSFFLD